jgi:hypothetical protein
MVERSSSAASRPYRTHRTVPPIRGDGMSGVFGPLFSRYL